MKLQRRGLDRPDELREMPDGELRIFELADGMASWTAFQPGWRWSTHVKPIAGTDYCEFHHVGFTLSGRVRVEHRDGTELELQPQQFYEIPPFHDAWVVGDEPWISIDWGPGFSFARREGTATSRRVGTLLFTDIVESTALAARLGDGRWRDVLAEHNRRVRRELERYGGREMTTTGDGFLALFDSAESAVRCALAAVDSVRSGGVEIRCGIHTGEVELESSNVRGLTVHAAARVLGLAGPGEVLVSWTTRDLLAGARLVFDSRGEHELKGLPEARPIYVVRAAG
ncbi:MAG TPA: adenylate/guanylate cyclase domain-containing protein [Candidatus Limnocylindrales bacterium]|nr:adenylate/guanylate cyclase domain-containing protein [Candidatus Limnocylindrales bacterium]